MVYTEYHSLNVKDGKYSDTSDNENDFDNIKNKFRSEEEGLLEPTIVPPAKLKRKSKRLYWADCARIFSMLSIIFLHASGYGCERSLRKIKDPTWYIVCWLNCLSRFSVPMFVLLSGTFILDPSKNFTFKKLFGQNIFRLMTAYLFWATVNALINIFIYKKNKFGDFFRLVFVGEEYLWFIYMIVGCYIISPILRKFSDDVPLARYFLVLCIFWGSFIPTLKNTFSAFNMKGAQKTLNAWTGRWHYHFTLEFVGYFVAGYHIVKHVTIKKPVVRMIIYILGIADVILYSYLTYFLEKGRRGKYSKEFRDTYSLTVAFYTIVLFIFFKHEIGRINFSEKAIKIITKLSSLTFGVYLSHMIIKTMLLKYSNITQTVFLGYKYRGIIGVPVFWFVNTVLSFGVSYLLSITPILKNYVI
ncbi:hypothetical protein BCR32DRAFT_289042 [Anaeromyces robustus]|uniref:Acyltransferase 3 domain-containing protein n=1 Tax=Anaeromyces robustus TaxID=1754192 RepID=A0A1Y1XQA8_9FUNG|nr:hypothetical protein BCR32DRAFT_289042 [Anaeromyces robustus]|eukprot:ORX87927.1 hypothetical protein BCR32DRAFT_289042 [Anaeromyces robustus]